MSPIKNVAVIGGSGNIGKPIIDALLAAGFNVTALTRASSTSTFPDGVTVKKVDYDSAESLKSAFAGQDAVVSAIATANVKSQQVIIDAAAAAGVKRFIPSEFGINTRLAVGTPIGKILGGKVAVADYLEAKAKENSDFTWTAVYTGVFFDWGLDKNQILGIDWDKKTVRVVDSGNEKFQTSNLPYIAKAIVSILKHADKTANKSLSIASFNVSINEIVKAIEELSGTALTPNRVDSAVLQKLGEEKLAQGEFGAAFGPLVATWNIADGAGHALKPEDSANALLELPQDDFKATIKAFLASIGKL